MLIQILSHTPVYVWAILAVLVYRGVLAMRDREIAFRKLFIIPAIMLALSLHSIVTKFGLALLPLAAWTGGAATMLLLVWQHGKAKIVPGSAPGNVLVRGSRMPLVLMMAIFLTKYATAVVLSVQPQLASNGLFVFVLCGMLGVFSGYFLGRLFSDLMFYRTAMGGGAAVLA